jgi:hypothetical protein
VLKKALEDRIAALGRSGSWPEIIADLDSLTEAAASLTPPNRKCSAKLPARRGLPLPVSYLVIRTVEDGFE